jgi:hypothetical protein
MKVKMAFYWIIVFELSAAAVSQAVCGHGSDFAAPVVLLGLALASWARRPPNRILGATHIARADGHVSPIRSERAV